MRDICAVITEMLEVQGRPATLSHALEEVRELMKYKAPEQQRDAWHFIAVSLHNEYGRKGPKTNADKRLCEIFTLRKFT